jgi:hypothetical protein
MVSTTQQVARDRWDSPVVAESAQDAIRSLGSLEHLFWLFDQNQFVHFAVTGHVEHGQAHGPVAGDDPGGRRHLPAGAHGDAAAEAP